MSAHRDLTRGDGRLRIVPWRGDPETAHLTPARGRPTAVEVERSIATLASGGYRTALTSALAPPEAAPFLEAGFVVHERLHLLTRSVTEPTPEAPVTPLRRARRADRALLLTLDRDAFSAFWRLDEAGLDDALAATPSSRLRVADHADAATGLAGYAVTGRAGPRGYLQRLAVDPALQRRGIGSALVRDALGWLRRWGAREVFVNTQVDNDAALSLYLHLGFSQQPVGLAVLRRTLVQDGT
ncbi:MAG: GNAT family N-acetyltransferase [Microthrixaceae bacterium]